MLNHLHHTGKLEGSELEHDSLPVTISCEFISHINQKVHSEDVPLFEKYFASYWNMYNKFELYENLQRFGDIALCESIELASWMQSKMQNKFL